jgi:hypothetical protein
MFKLLLVRWCVIPSLIAFVACAAIAAWRGALFSAAAALVAFHVDVFACKLLDVHRPFRAPYSTEKLGNGAPSLVFMLTSVSGSRGPGGGRSAARGRSRAGAAASRAGRARDTGVLDDVVAVVVGLAVARGRATPPPASHIGEAARVVVAAVVRRA